MERSDGASMVSIYITENERYRGQPLYAAIIDHLRQNGATGATIFRGVEGFGVHQQIHTTKIEMLMYDLPIRIEWIDSDEQVDRILPDISAMLTEGLITVQPVRIFKHAVRDLRPISPSLTVADVMTSEPISVKPDSPLSDLVELLFRQLYRALPVIDDERHVVGIVTNGNLVERGGLAVRTDLLHLIDPAMIEHERTRLFERGGRAADVMTPNVTTIEASAPLNEAAHLMATRVLKRLPVIDHDQRLVGIISRVDVLRTLTLHTVSERDSPEPTSPITPSSTVADIMSRQVPTVNANSALPEVLEAVVSTRLNRAVVVDDHARPLGVITDAELMRRLDPRHQSSIIRVLMRHIPFLGLSPEEREELHVLTGTRAGDLMISPALTVTQTMPVVDAARRMLERRYKILPVVEDTGQIVGLIDRADLLRALATT